MGIVRLGAETGETHYGTMGIATWEQAALAPGFGYLALIAARKNLRLPALDDVEDAAPLVAYLHADTWLVACPDCVQDFQVAWCSGPRLYMCTNCWNHAAGGSWRRYVLPDEAEAIEVAVADVERGRRNWLPGWTKERALLEASSGREVRQAEFTAALQGARAGRDAGRGH